MAFYTQEDFTATYDVVTLEMVKRHLKFDDPTAEHEEDSLVELYIDAAIKQAENYINTEISEKKFKVNGESFTAVLSFKKQRIKSIDSLKYKDVDGNNQDLEATLYRLNQVDKFEYNVEFLDTLPAVKENDYAAVELVLILGFKRLPKDIKSAILLLISDMYEVRSDRPKHQNTAAFNLLKPYRYYPNE